jgi:hypothetical protein
MYNKDMSTHQMLAALGYVASDKPLPFHRKEITKDGEVVGRFTCYECNDYLRQKHPEFFATEEEVK